MVEEKHDINDLLFHLYYNPKSSAAFSSPERLYNIFKKTQTQNLSRSDVIKWLQKQDAYTLHRSRRYKFKRNHYNITNLDDLWEMDLIDMQKISKFNKGYKYILAVIDCFSKFAWCIPIKRKKPDDVVSAFNVIFAKTDRKPVKIQSDKGREFVNRKVKEYFNELNIEFFTTRDPTTKAAICERFIKTIKGIIYKYFTYSKSKKYTDVLDGLTCLYNNRFHSSIGMEPNSVNDGNILKVWEYMSKKQNKRLVKRKPCLCIGDKVRVANSKAIFDKGYIPQWSDELFTIEKVLLRKPVVYNIRDVSGVTINGNFYESELQKAE